MKLNYSLQFCNFDDSPQLCSASKHFSYYSGLGFPTVIVLVSRKETENENGEKLVNRFPSASHNTIISLFCTLARILF